MPAPLYPDPHARRGSAYLTNISLAIARAEDLRELLCEVTATLAQIPLPAAASEYAPLRATLARQRDAVAEQLAAELATTITRAAELLCTARAAAAESALRTDPAPAAAYRPGDIVDTHA